MVKYTNKHNLPDYVVEYLKFDEYDYEEGVISATRLMSPARQFALYKSHKDELECDVSDLVASRYGTAIHDSMEKVKLKGCEQEIRLRHTMPFNNDFIKLSGKFDIMRMGDTQKLIDVKSTSVWSWVFNSKEKDYVQQLSTYRYLANKNGYNVGREAEILMFFTDWNRTQAKKSPDYPSLRVAIKPILLMNTEDTEKYILERLTKLTNATESEEKDLPLCSDEELWKDEDKWAITTPKRKRALKLCSTMEEANEYLLKNKLSQATIEKRPGKVRRCEYCMARKWCSQYKTLVLDGGIQEIDKEEVKKELIQATLKGG